jgi:hypothetical protein
MDNISSKSYIHGLWYGFMSPFSRSIILLVLGIVLALIGAALSWRLLIELVGLLLLILGVAFIGLSLALLRR